MYNNLISNVQWLVPIENCTIELAEKSNLASVRLRCALSAVEYKKMGFNVSFNDGFGSGFPDVLFVGKIDNITDKSRSERWINYIIECQKNGGQVIIDYTDHHLSAENDKSTFYKKALPNSDSIICSSNLLAKHLETFGFKKSTVIPDPYEVELTLPNDKKNSIKTALWFGHSTNIPYFLNFLLKLKGFQEPLKIIALTNAYPIPDEILKKLAIIVPDHIDICFLPWSLDNLIHVAKMSDFTLIPAGVDNPRKSGASSNRLITSLVLGLPTLADPLDSYLEFSEFFKILSIDNLTKFIKHTFEDQLEVVCKAQILIAQRFSKDGISIDWSNFIKKLPSQRIH